MKPSILVLNASLGGKAGNTAVLLDRAAAVLSATAEVTSIALDATQGFAETEPYLKKADAFLIGTGTHWDSWSHLLQKFLEDSTASEGTGLWLAKPAGVIVTMHSVGGKEVLSRLQGVLNTFGCTIPPMSGLVYSFVNQTAIAAETADSLDLWCPEDVDVICHNLLAALNPQPHYKTWPVDRSDFASRWIRPSR